MRFLSSAFSPQSTSLSLSLSLSFTEWAAISFGGHKSVTALKMTDTACWSHGQEREASRCYKVDKLTHTPIHAQQTHTHTHTHTRTQTMRNEIPLLVSPIEEHFVSGLVVLNFIVYACDQQRRWRRRWRRRLGNHFVDCCLFFFYFFFFSFRSHFGPLCGSKT